MKGYKLETVGKRNSIQRLVITDKHIADLLGIKPESLKRAILRKQIDIAHNTLWKNFWNLVEYLEQQNLRPK